jgi:hypothetical protein
MLRVLICLALVAWGARGAERSFDFSRTEVNHTPQGFRSAVAGIGGLADWKVLLDDVPSAKPVGPGQAPLMTKQSVLAQLAQDKADEHVPLFIFEGETFEDFTFTTRLKTVSGEVERMAGVAFRLQDEKNYYYVRVSSLGNNIRFFKVVDGARSQTLIGRDLPVPSGQWHELSVECRGNQIRILLNGEEAMPTLTDRTFAAGKIGFWTKSDSVSHFTDARVVYTPREKLADSLIRRR